MSDTNKLIESLIDENQLFAYGLSIRQPWAWAVFHAPYRKNIENRGWKPPDKALYSRILIQASKTCTVEEYEKAARYIRIVGGQEPPPLKELPRGAIVGSVVVRGYVESGSRAAFGNLDTSTWRHAQHSPWFTGPIGWILTQPIAYKPLLYKAHQWLFRVPVSRVRRLVVIPSETERRVSA